MLEVKNGTPVFHGAEELTRSRPADDVELRQWLRRAEVVMVVRQHLRHGVQSEACARRISTLHDDTDISVAELPMNALEVTCSEEQQVDAHLRRLLEAHAFHALR